MLHDETKCNLRPWKNIGVDTPRVFGSENCSGMADIKGLSVAIILGLDSSETKSIQRRGRTIRKEGDKVAEIFNIVIDQTIETKWFANSHKTSSFITIDEENEKGYTAYETGKNYMMKDVIGKGTKRTIDDIIR